MGNGSPLHLGFISRIPHKKIVITTSILLTAVPATALAVSHHHTDKSPVNHSAVQVQATQTSRGSETTHAADNPAESYDDTTASSNNETTVIVNGQKLDMPENGTVYQTIQNEDGNTSVEVNSSSTGTASNSSHSSTSISIQSSSNSTVTGGSNTFRH